MKRPEVEEEKLDLLDEKQSQNQGQTVYFDNPFSTTVQTADGLDQTDQPLIAAVIPNDHFALATFVTVCCFWPIGIFALWKSREVYRCSARGDIRGAKKASNLARVLSWTTLIVGLLFIIVVAIFVTVNAHNILR